MTRFLIAALFVVFSWAGGLAPNTPALAADAVRIAIGQDFKPFEFVDNKGQATGLTAEIWRFWSKKTGIPIEFKPAPWSDTLEMMKDGRADIHAGLN